ncbi:MAG: aconitate hydratase [Firmicutes bacterium]|nr:aconitate hydratase [Bacillota bacterium]
MEHLPGQNLVQRIIARHLISGEMVPGKEIAVRIDQTLTQDATGTLAYLQFEAMGIPRVRTKRSVSYVDHNTLQVGFENADDHKFLRTAARKYGVLFSRAGNGICHQVHLERFGVPGDTLLGSDSHTPTQGGLGMLAIGAGGLDVAVAMAGGPFYLAMPKVLKVLLKGDLSPWVSAKDIILEILRRLTVRGGVGKVLEYSGDGVAGLSVTERATIANMGAELGATSSVFPSDDVTLRFLQAQERETDFVWMGADPDAVYDETLEMDLEQLEPLAAMPHSPDNVAPVRDLKDVRVDQVAIGSCTNSSFEDLMTVAAIFRGRRVNPDVDVAIAPGSKQVLLALAETGALKDIIASGARILESACGPCIGMGQAPRWEGVSLRTFNRNFEGRSGTPSAGVYLVSPEVAAASALAGFVTDPRELGRPVRVELPERFPIDDSMVLEPAGETEAVEIYRGPNIKPLPESGPLPENLQGPVLLKVGDNITTDHILPAGAKILPLRSNIPAIAEHVFTRVDPGFPARAKERGVGVVVGGSNYGQGSSREHAALAPRFLGVRAVIAKSFARIHYANLVNFGIVPLCLADGTDYDRVSQDDVLEIAGVRSSLESGSTEFNVKNLSTGDRYLVRHSLSPRQVAIVMAGGLLNHTRQLEG